MKPRIKKSIALLICVLVIVCACADKKNTKKNAPENMIQNGDFSGTLCEPWGLFLQGGIADLSVVNAELQIHIRAPGRVDYGVQLFQDGFSLEAGCFYRMSFDAYATVPRVIEYRIQLNGGDYHAYSSEAISLTTEKQTFVIDFEMTGGTDPAPRLVFNMGLPKGENNMPEHNVYVDSVSLTMTDDSNKIIAEPEEKRPDILVDQLAYTLSEQKIAVIRAPLGSPIKNETFEVADAESGKTVYKGEIGGGKENKTAGETNAYADFSELRAPGRYFIRSKTYGDSFAFSIEKDGYQKAFADIVKMLYLQRCGSALDERYAGKFAHPVCHHTPARVYGSNKTVDVSGGWHDAGDYGRYVSPGAKALADILLAYRLFPDVFNDALGIPESGNGVPDILDEARWEMEWLLKMQDPQSGGVYHKVTCASFPGFVMPEEETDELLLAPISTTATGAFCAVAAMFAETYRPYDEEFARVCLSAAEKAWQYLEVTPNSAGFKNPDDITTGEYGDGMDRDERYWAAVELFKLTKNKKYEQAIAEAVKYYVPYGWGWQAVGYYGSWSYLNISGELKNGALYEKIRESFFEQVNSLIEKSKNDGYMISLGESYPWGSNMTVANNAMMLLLAARLEPENGGQYVTAARDHVHYCFGRNPMATSYVTGCGTLTPLHPHHRPSEAKASPMPGMLVGGPDGALEDPYVKTTLAGKPPAVCYADNSQSFSTNEITIYWNSPLIFALSGVISYSDY